MGDGSVVEFVNSMRCSFPDGGGVVAQLVLLHLCPAATLDVRCFEPTEVRVMQACGSALGWHEQSVEVLTSFAGVARNVAAAASSLAGFGGNSTGMCESVSFKTLGLCNDEQASAILVALWSLVQSAPDGLSSTFVRVRELLLN